MARDAVNEQPPSFKYILPTPKMLTCAQGEDVTALERLAIENFGRCCREVTDYPFVQSQNQTETLARYNLDADIARRKMHPFGRR